jgi:hypothetical protein
MGGSGRGLGMRDYAGGVEIRNMTGNEDISLDFVSGQAIIASNVTSGTVVVRGNAALTDLSTSAAVINKSNLMNPYVAADQVWNEATTDHSATDTFGGYMVDVHKIERNRWIISSNQMVIFDDDASTRLYTFNLYNELGSATDENVYERVPV